MKLGTGVGLGPGDIVLDGDPAPSAQKGDRPTQIFDSCLFWPNGCMDQDETWRGGRPRPWPYCVRWGPSSSPSSKGAQLLIFGPCLLWPNGCMHQDTTSYGGRPRRLCVRWGPSCPRKGHSPLPPNFRPMSVVAKWLVG